MRDNAKNIGADTFEWIYFSSMGETLVFHMDLSLESVDAVFSKMSLLNEPLILFRS